MDVFCRYISEDRSASSKNSPNLAVTMLSFALFYLVAVACSGRWTQALPLFPDTDLEPPAGERKHNFDLKAVLSVLLC